MDSGLFYAFCTLVCVCEGGPAAGGRDPGVPGGLRLVAGHLQPLPLRCHHKGQVLPYSNNF